MQLILAAKPVNVRSHYTLYYIVPSLCYTFLSLQQLQTEIFTSTVPSGHIEPFLSDVDYRNRRFR